MTGRGEMTEAGTWTQEASAVAVAQPRPGDQRGVRDASSKFPVRAWLYIASRMGWGLRRRPLQVEDSRKEPRYELRRDEVWEGRRIM